MKLDITPEECCEDCGDIVHNHIDCPVCKNTYARTDQYGPIGEILKVGELMECECGAKFKLIKAHDYMLDEYEWELL